MKTFHRSVVILGSLLYNFALFFPDLRDQNLTYKISHHVNIFLSVYDRGYEKQTVDNV